MDTTTASVAEELKKVDLFAGLSKRHLERLADKTRSVPHGAGKEIAHEGADGCAFHLMVSGSVEVLVHGEPRATLGPGEYFGEISLIDGKPRAATVRTTSAATTLAIDVGDFRALMDHEPGFTRALLLKLCERLRERD